MTTPNNPLQEQVAAAEQIIGQARALWVAAAQKSDSAEGLGADGRIQLVHGLVDLWVNNSKPYVLGALKNGWVADAVGPHFFAKAFDGEAE